MSSKFDQLAASGETKQGEVVDKRLELIDDLQEEIQRLKDARREDAFIFVVVSMLLLDVAFFAVMPTFGGPLALLILQLIILVPVARKLGMDEIVLIVSRTLERLSSKGGGEE